MTTVHKVIISVLVFLSGVAGLSWELLWQHHASLALGVSAQATALVLACTMTGMALGSSLVGRWLRAREPAQPLRLYAVCELTVGISGLLLEPGFAFLQTLDVTVHRSVPGLLPFVQVLGIAALLVPPTMAMGATIPIFVLIARRVGGRIAVLYSLNTAGAALGVLVAAFHLLPRIGVSLTVQLCVIINLAVAAVPFCFRLGPPKAPEPPSVEPTRAGEALPLSRAGLLVFVTGFVTFALEIAWFRSFRAAYQSTTDSFAVILASVLVPLAVGARIAPRLPPRRAVIALVSLLAGSCVLLLTPLVERLDTIDTIEPEYWHMIALRLGLGLAIVSPPVLLLGTVLPWILERHRETGATGQLYALNTVGAVLGSLSAAWLLLPTVGVAATAWTCGALLVAAALVASPRLGRKLLPIAIGSLLIAVALESGVGRLRAQGPHLRDVEYRVLASREGPDSTVSVIEHADGTRELVIDGFETSSDGPMSHYMIWMGRLPMIMHPHPRRALVICFGVGQTANAVRRENPTLLDVVELNPAVLEMARFFDVNEDVLADNRVHAHVMDGRAWLRRTTARYDVVTLEPMAPHFAGTNSLYSLEFYRLVSSRLNQGGVVAQWLPFHLVSTSDAPSISRTFTDVFPHAWLWVDPVDGTGILVGVKDGRLSLDPPLPGLDHVGIERDLDAEAVRRGFRLGPDGLAQYRNFGGTITDDNQRLAYGRGRREYWRYASPAEAHRANLSLVRMMANRAEHARAR